MAEGSRSPSPDRYSSALSSPFSSLREQHPLAPPPPAAPPLDVANNAADDSDDDSEVTVLTVEQKATVDFLKYYSGTVLMIYLTMNVAAFNSTSLPLTDGSRKSLFELTFAFGWVSAVTIGIAHFIKLIPDCLQCVTGGSLLMTECTLATFLFYIKVFWNCSWQIMAPVMIGILGVGLILWSTIFWPEVLQGMVQPDVEDDMSAWTAARNYLNVRGTGEEDDGDDTKNVEMQQQPAGDLEDGRVNRGHWHAE